MDHRHFMILRGALAGPSCVRERSAPGDDPAKHCSSREIPPVLADLALTFEPSLFVVGQDGLMKRRLDNVLDAEELHEALSSV